MTTKKSIANDFIDKADKYHNAINHTYSEMDEVFALLVMAREYAKGGDSSKWTTSKGIDAILSRLIDIQSSMMDNAGLEY